MPNLLTARRYYEWEVFKKDKNVVYEIFQPKHVSLPEGTFLEFGTIDNKRFYRLSDLEEENTQALLISTTVNHNNKEYCEISNVEVLTRRKGYCSFLYKIVITTSDIPIISDNLNTLPGSFNIWKYLRFSWKPKNYQIGYINLSYNRIYKWSGKTPDHHIWGMQTILLNDYQELENDDIFDEMLEMDDLSKDHYLFLSKYKKYLKDRDYIRLFVTRK